MTTGLHRAARAYVQRLGWPVLPCAVQGKVPAIAGGNGWKDATSDIAVIDTWWTMMPQANIGVALAPAGLVVLDVDPRNGGDLDDVVRAFGPLPETCVCLTGGGGVHVYFARPPDAPATKDTLLPGVEILATGYSVLPPSMHPSGRPYVWEITARPDAVPIADAPACLVAPLLAKPAPSSAPPTGLVADSLLGRAFVAAGWWLREIDATRAVVLCPWRDLHTTGRDGDSSTVLFAPVTGDKVGKLYCAHTHPQGRTAREVLAALPSEAVTAAEAALGRGARPHRRWVIRVA